LLHGGEHATLDQTNQAIASASSLSALWRPPSDDAQGNPRERKYYFMRLYELGLILRVDKTEDELAELVETIKRWIANQDGKIVKEDVRGRRRLAYSIAKQRDGYYIFYEIELPTTAPAEIERNLNISEDVLRFLFVRVEEEDEDEAEAEEE
jgi:small subunit ribosomal protein S6